MAEGSTAVPCSVKVDTAPLLANKQDEDFATLADLKLVWNDGEETFVLPCHSCALASASKVLCKMFASTEKGGWQNGVDAIFVGHLLTSVRLVLAMAHGRPDVGAMMNELDIASPLSWTEIEDLFVLVNKLDATWLAEVRNQ